MQLLSISPFTRSVVVIPDRALRSGQTESNSSRLLSHWREAEQNVAARQAQLAAAATAQIPARAAKTPVERVRFAHD